MNISSPFPVVTRESLKETPFRLMRWLPLIAGLTVLALICLVWNAFTLIKQIEQLERQCLRLAELQGTIVHLDEVRTMSARMAAATGNARWEARYREFEPKLASAIREALAITPKFRADKLVASTLAANSALVGMENRVFELVHFGQLKAARATLDSGEYRRQKEIYIAGMSELNSVLTVAVPRYVEQKIQGVTWVLITSAVVLPLLVSCLTLTLRTSDRWKSALVQQSAHLAELNIGLDRMVSQRTSELECSREIARQVLNTAYDPFIAIGIDGRISEWNAQAGAIFGWTREEALGLRLSETIIPLRYRDDHDRGMKHYHATGESPFLNRNIEFNALHRDGHEIPVEIIIWPVGVGRTTSFNAFVRNITRRKLEDEALAERARLTALSADVGIALAQSDSLPMILQHCCEALVRHLNASLARVWTIDNSGKVLDLQASAGMYTHVDGEHTHIHVGKSSIGYIALEGKPYFTNHVVDDARVCDEWAIREGMVAFAGHPLVVEGELMGIMAIYALQPLARATFDALGIVANSVALGIKRKSAENDLRQAKAAAEAANRARQEQFLELEHLYRTAPVGLELIDSDYRVIRVNERLAAINGISVDQHLGRTLREIIPQFASQIERVVAQVFATGEPVLNIEVHGITQADPTTERDWIVGYYPVKAQNGVPRYVGCVVTEISELKKVEVDLRRHKDLLQTVIDHIPCAVFWKDRQSVNLGGNQLAASDLGFASPAEMIGKNNFDLSVTREEAESFTRYDREVMESGKPLLHCEEVLTKPDGTRLEVLTSKVPLRDVAGEVFGVLAIYLDISERKRAEQQLANHAKQLQEQAELLDLAHDAITVRGLDGAFSFWSKGAEEMHGWTSAERSASSRMTSLIPASQSP